MVFYLSETILPQKKPEIGILFIFLTYDELIQVPG